MHIALLAVEKCLYSCITGMRDMFVVAGARGSGGHETPSFDVTVRTAHGRPVQAFGGFPLAPDGSLNDKTLPIPDVLILPAILDDLDALCTDAPLLNAIRHLHHSGTLMASVCAGSFLLGAAGILDRREATTHWNLAEDFRNRFPKVKLRAERMLVDGGDYICAGGVTAYLDLALYLVSRFRSTDEAASLARLMLIDPHRETQTPYCMAGFRKNHGDRAILPVQEWLEEHYAEPLTVTALASRASLGERTFLRRFRAATGETPVGYLQRLRMEAARRLLESTTMNVEEITVAVGYADSASFRRLFRSVTGMPPAAYRERFAIKGLPARPYKTVPSHSPSR